MEVVCVCVCVCTRKEISLDLNIAFLCFVFAKFITELEQLETKLNGNETPV